MFCHKVNSHKRRGRIIRWLTDLDWWLFGTHTRNYNPRRNDPDD